MKNLLFFDIDGTILSEGSHRYIPDSAIKAIKLLQKNGNLCFINTGRSWAEIGQELIDIQFDGFVCGCGTYIRCHDKVIYSKKIPVEISDSILDGLNQCHLEWLLEGEERIFYSNIPYETHIGDFHREYHQLFPNHCEDISPDTRGIRFDKFCICVREDSDLETFQKANEDHFWFIDRGNGFFEVIPLHHSKASGIQFLMDYFSVPLENTYAIGDSTNDLPMLEFAGTSIAMKKSDDIVLKTVDYVTDTVENDGIYKAMKHFHLI